MKTITPLPTPDAISMWKIRGYDASSGRVHSRSLLETSDICISFWLNGIVMDSGKPFTVPFGYLSERFSLNLVL